MSYYDKGTKNLINYIFLCCTNKIISQLTQNNMIHRLNVLMYIEHTTTILNIFHHIPT